jgi:hypothetical protein
VESVVDDEEDGDDMQVQLWLEVGGSLRRVCDPTTVTLVEARGEVVGDSFRLLWARTARSA